MALQFSVFDHIEPIPGLDLEHIVWLLRLGAICTRAKLKLRIQPTQMAEFDLRHVEPTTVFGGIMELEFICDSFRLRRIKGFIKRCFGVRIEIELVASFRNLSKFLKSWEKTDGRAVCAVGAYGPNNMAIRRIPGPHSATNSPAIF
jgi:hypothetical protein